MARCRPPRYRQREPPRSCASPQLRNRPADAVREQIVEVDMELDDAAVTVPGKARRRQDRLSTDLEILPGPDDPGLDRAVRLTGRYPIDRTREGDLHQGDQSVERRAKPDVLHATLQIRQAVLEREAVIEVGRVRNACALGLGRKVETEIAGDRKRTQVRERPRQVAQSFAEIE